MIDVEMMVRQHEHLVGAQGNWRSYWQDLADFVLPRKAWITTIKTQGERLKFNFLFDSTAIRALKIMAAGFHSNLTNPASKWFALQTRDLRWMERQDVQLWFKQVEDIMFSVFNTSNFDTAMQEFYMDAGGFGTGAIYTEDDSQDKVRFHTIPIEQMALVEDFRGRVFEFYRAFRLTAQQAFRLWGPQAGPSVAESIRDQQYFRTLEFLHYVGPRHQWDAGKSDGVNMPWVSAWVALKDKRLISEGGFLEFPYAVGRFYKDANEVFGYSPAMDALADIKGINAQKRTLLRAAMKIADPAMAAPSRGFLLPLNLNPAAMNYYDAKSTTVDALKPIQSTGNIPITADVIKMTQEDIEQTFFVPLFRSISDINKQMTVPEVQRRIAENMVLLGPVVGRFTHEVLNPLVLRTFFILQRQGELPEPPGFLQGQEMDVIYLSPLAKAQRASEMSSLQTYLVMLGEIAKVKPDVLDTLNEDRTAHILADIQGIDPTVTRDPREVEELRQQRQQAQAAALQLEAMHKGAQIAESGAKAGKHATEAMAE